jgi:[acyl-carrier-protein] S-malonyltransferase
MRAVLAGALFADPDIAVISNVTAQPIRLASALPEELTVQITNPVLWLASVATMQAAGVEEFIEFGPGRVLTGLVRRIDRGFATRNIGTVEEAQG